MRKEAIQRCGAHGRLGSLRDLELRLIKSIVKVLCQHLYVVNQGCFGVDTDRNDCESALPVLELRLVN